MKSLVFLMFNIKEIMMSSTERQDVTSQLSEEIYQYVSEFYQCDIDIEDLNNIIDANIGSVLEQLNEIG